MQTTSKVGRPSKYGSPMSGYQRVAESRARRNGKKVELSHNLFNNMLTTLSKPNILPFESTSLEVTPSIASDWLSNFNYKHQRKIRPLHVNSLARMMENGCFRQKTQINFMKLGSDFYLTNGQHTLSAIVKSGVFQNLCVIVSNAKTMCDIADDFARHDTHLTRQLSDSLHAHELDVEIGVTKTDLQFISAASLYLSFLKGESNRSSIRSYTNDEKLVIVRKYGYLGRDALSFFVGNTQKTYLTRKTTLAVVMACKEATENAGDFWTALANDDGLRANDPRKTLLEWLKLKMTAGSSWGAVNSKKQTANDHELVKGIASAWNAWVEGRQLKCIKINFDSATVELNRVGVFNVKQESKNLSSDKTGSGIEDRVMQ